MGATVEVESCSEQTVSDIKPAATPIRTTPHPPAKLTFIKAEEYFKDCSPLQLATCRAVGLTVATVIACLYYVTPLLFLILPYWVLHSHFSFLPTALFTGYILLSYWPITPTVEKPTSWFFRCMALYFDSELMLERKPEVYGKHPKPIIWLSFPHGIIAFSGPAYGILYRARAVRSAAADIVLRMPFIRQVFGPFNLTSGSRRTLATHLKKENLDVWIYPGGLAELFLSDMERENVFFEKRLGIIRLAMETGSDVTVTYLFGNSLVYSLLCSKQTEWLSRQLKISLTLFWGRFGTCLPRYSKLLAATSEVIEMPDFSANPEGITDEILKSQHQRVKQELMRVYETYRRRHPEYSDRPLHIM